MLNYNLATFLGLGAVLGLGMIVACSGGTENPTLRGMGPGADESPQPRPPEGSQATTPPTPTPTPTNTTTNTTTTSTDCYSCYDLIAGTAVGEPCATSTTVIESLYFCLCDSYCTGDCVGLCDGGTLDSTCSACMTSYCTTEYSNCVSDY